MIRYTHFDSSIGRIFLAKSRIGLCRIGLPGESELSLLMWLRHEFPDKDPVRTSDTFLSVEKELMDYLSGDRKEFTFDLDVRTSRFRKRALKEVQAIPYGETASYKQIAERMGEPGAVRAVGGANANNPLPIVIPCHRVIAHDGTLGGYGGGLNLKAYFLQLEGALL